MELDLLQMVVLVARVLKVVQAPEVKHIPNPQQQVLEPEQVLLEQMVVVVIVAVAVVEELVFLRLEALVVRTYQILMVRLV